MAESLQWQPFYRLFLLEFRLVGSSKMNAPDIANKAAELIGGDRAQTHGDMHAHFAHVAAIWTAYLGRQLEAPLSAVDVPHMMGLLKIARTKSGGVNVDDWIDGAGYIACAGEIASYSRMDNRGAGLPAQAASAQASGTI
jgi:hypothetical protein